MNVFHRTRRDDRVLGCLGIVIAFIISTVFMLLGFGLLAVDVADAFNWVFGLVFGLIGLAVFVISVCGGWRLTNGPITHVSSVDEQSIEWGFLGKEVRASIEYLECIYWSDYDGLTCVLYFRDGRRVRLPYIENVLTPKSRVAFLEIHGGQSSEYPDRRVASERRRLVDAVALRLRSLIAVPSRFPGRSETPSYVVGVLRGRQAAR